MGTRDALLGADHLGSRMVWERAGARRKQVSARDDRLAGGAERRAGGCCRVIIGADTDHRWCRRIAETGVGAATERSPLAAPLATV
jgi:hypothetical protein